jgi:hypothetical protein
MTDDKNDYVYLSDGGHFENLGLYEMVLRRCRRIVVSDAGCDPKCALEDLGNAIRKIRIDLGIRIEIESEFKICSRKPYSPSKYCAIGTIHYGDVDRNIDGTRVLPGRLLYIKPAIAGDEPKDVYNYKEESLLFPHEPTSDQWFSESQFESYRALGKHILAQIWKGNDGAKKATDGHDGELTENAQTLLGLEYGDPLEYLLRAAENYVKTPFPNMPDLSAAQRDVLLVGKANIGI